MNGLLTLLRSEADSKFGWSGCATHPVCPPTPEPRVLTSNNNASIVAAGGSLTQRTMLKTALLVSGEARLPGRRIVYLALSLTGGRLGALQTAGDLLQDARHHAAIVVYLQGCAFGPALWLAMQCDLIFCHPTASIGWTGCVSEKGELDGDATRAMSHELAALSPHVPLATWSRLSQSWITGEQAEAIGIISHGSLRRDVFDLSGIDPNRWPT